MSFLNKITDELSEAKRIVDPSSLRRVRKEKDSGSGGGDDDQQKKDGGKDDQSKDGKGGDPGNQKDGEGEGGQGSSGDKKDGKKSQGKGQGKGPGDEVKDDGEGEGDGEGKQGDKDGKKSQGKGSGKANITIDKEGNIYKDGKKVGKTPGKVADDHSNFDDGGGDIRDIMQKVYEKASAKDRGSGSGGAGSGGGTMREKIEGYLKPKFDVKSILKRLDAFKKAIAESIGIDDEETYQASAFNPTTQTGEMLAPGDVDAEQKKLDKISAILIFAVDTSGSISSQDYQAIFGYLNRISTHFSKPKSFSTAGGSSVSISGEVYLIEWDDGVHWPMRKWTQVSRGKIVPHLNDKDEKEGELKGGGGTNINKLFQELDNKLYSPPPKGKENQGGTFILDDRADYVQLSRKLDDKEGNRKNKAKAKKFSVKLKKQKSTKLKDVDMEEVSQNVDMSSGAANFVEGRKKFGNVPFLLIYTDGFFATANYKTSKLYADNPGNILYVLTNKGGLSNIRPINFIMHELEE